MAYLIKNVEQLFIVQTNLFSNHFQLKKTKIFLISFSLIYFDDSFGYIINNVDEINSSTTNGPTIFGSDFFGTSVANIGDLDGNGISDLLVGSNSASGGGNVRGVANIIFLNMGGSISSTVEINSSTDNGPIISDGDQFGGSVTSIGDLDGDGVQDLAVGAGGNDDSGDDNKGAIHIMFMNTDGSVDSTVEINSSTLNGPTLLAGDLFGSSIANLGDLDGDGVQDLVVGASNADTDGTDRGTIHILFMNTDGSVDSTVEINDTTTNGLVLSNNDKFGSSVANIGDLDGDGVLDIAVGAPGNSGSIGTILTPACETPMSGDWIVTLHCILYSDYAATGSVTIQNNVVLTIVSGTTLDIDFTTNNLTVKSGSGVLIKSGGTIS